ncbi:hypothetical protein [Polyangium jinanense]|uniref:Uncharacterized protein n=1 Tax=Polyangium jinanense TaxID=2829994 RepID=A0A9X3XFX0_9BACT|nr:hypothetical protein [Polyangium jinanense]MDC3961681.1 hypothetical protein [Polyangium jinanense]MDC3983932.1 hypothetical protein [Polyangium jinanense]MDC3987271.1 hypothetical protein [Polyangium jinanense]
MKMTPVQRETLTDGTVRLRGSSCAYLFTRPRPRATLVTITGRDVDELGDAPTAEVDAEIQRFGAPLLLFVDPSAATSVANAVADRWTSWFARRRSVLERVDILVSSRYLELTVAWSRHYSGAGDLIRIHNDPARFDVLLASAAPGAQRPAPSRFTEPAAPIQRTRAADGALALSSLGLTFGLSSPGDGALYTTIRGVDRGQLGGMPFDEIFARMPASGAPITLFVDTRGASAPAEIVRDSWSAWFSAARARLRRVFVLVDSGAVRFNVAMAKHGSNTDALVAIHTDPGDFARAAQSLLPGFVLPPV